MSQRIHNTETITFNGQISDPICPVFTNAEHNIDIDKTILTEGTEYSINEMNNQLTITSINDGLNIAGGTTFKDRITGSVPGEKELPKELDYDLL